MIKRLLAFIIILLSSMSSFAQEKWAPKASWPFAYRRFEPAMVYTGLFKQTKTQVPANIHIGNHTLWFSKNDTLMEASNNTIIRVVFQNGDAYVPTINGEIGKVLREDTINGRIARLIQVWMPDQRKIDDEAKARLQTRQLGADTGGACGFASIINKAAEALEGEYDEDAPFPTTNVFYMFVNGKMFEATESNIIKYLGKSRKHEYLTFTRTAEILSTSPNSMMKVWDTFICPKTP